MKIVHLRCVKTNRGDTYQIDYRMDEKAKLNFWQKQTRRPWLDTKQMMAKFKNQLWFLTISTIIIACKEVVKVTESYKSIRLWPKMGQEREKRMHAKTTLKRSWQRDNEKVWVLKSIQVKWLLLFGRKRLNQSIKISYSRYRKMLTTVTGISIKLHKVIKFHIGLKLCSPGPSQFRFNKVQFMWVLLFQDKKRIWQVRNHWLTVVEKDLILNLR